MFIPFFRYERQVSTYIIPDSKVFSRFVAGASAGATATAATYPLDLVRARMAADWATQPKYSGVSGALIDVVRKEGPASLWRGIGPTLLGIAPYVYLINFSNIRKLMMVYAFPRVWSCIKKQYSLVDPYDLLGMRAYLLHHSIL